MNKKYSVLLFGNGGRQALPITKGFSNLGCKVTSYCESRLDTGFLTRYADERIVYSPRNAQGKSFDEYGLSLIKTGNYDLVVPLGDVTATLLSKNKAELEKYAYIFANDWEIFSKVIDKIKLMELCQDNGIPCARTIISDDPLKELDKTDINYPVVIKPRTACGSVGFNIAKDREHAEQILRNYDNEHGPLLVQEFIPHDGGQYEVDIFRDRNGGTKAVLVAEAVRIFPLDGGSPVLSKTLHDRQMQETAKKLLDTLNWNGFMDIDMIFDTRDNTAKVIEANPRVCADIKIDFLSGVDITKLILDNAFSDYIPNMSYFKDDIKLVCGVTDILWLIKNKQRFTEKPSWFDRRGFKDAIFSWDDPLPFAGFCLQHALHYKEDMRKRKRS